MFLFGWPGIYPSVGRFSFEFGIHMLGGRHAHLGNVGDIHGVPVKHGIKVIEHAFAGHKYFGALGFLGGSTVDAEGAGDALLLHQVLDRQCSSQRPGTNKVVAAAVTGGDTVFTRLLLGDGLVAKVWQCVIFEQNAELWLSGSVFRDEGRGNARRFFAGDGEAALLQQVFKISGRLGFEE